jgi:hypothetical protein
LAREVAATARGPLSNAYPKEQLASHDARATRTRYLHRHGNTGAVENAEGKHNITVRFDDQPAENWGTSESTDKKSLFIAPIYATRIAVVDERLKKSQQMLVRFTPFNASPVTFKFDIRGFASHADRVLGACPEVDRSKWLFPPRQGLRPKV